MMAYPTQVPYPIYQDKSGNPLESGYVYFGEPNLNPQTNPKSIYWDMAGTIAAAQPVRTTGGYTARNGRSANVYLSGNYSITVLDRDGTLIYSNLNVSQSAPLTALAVAGESTGAALVGFLQSGTGAIPRILQDKERETVSVTDFGAVGDGVTDDTAAIQLAIDYCTNLSNRKQTLSIPANDAGSTYKITSPLVINGRLNIVGDGEFSTTILADGFSAGEFILDFYNDAADSVYFGGVSGITLRGSNTNPTGIRLRNISYVLLKNVQLYGLDRGVFITGTNCFSNFFEYITGYDIQRYTVQWETFSGGGHYTFTGCTFSGTDGVYLASDSVTDALSFHGCNFEQCTTTDIYIAGSVAGLTIFGGRSEGLDGTASFLINPVPGKAVTGLVVSGFNWSSDSGAATPIVLGGAGGLVKGFSITGNTTANIGSTQFVHLNGAGDSGVIAGNYLPDSPKVVSAPRAGVVVYSNYNSSGALPEYWGTASWAVKQGTFTATATGMTTSPTGTVNYSIVGNSVTLDFPAISGTSNSTAFTLTGAPVDIRPTTEKDLLGRVVDNGSGVLGMIRVKTTGVIELFASISGAAFTAAGTKAVNTNSITYTLA